MKEYQAKKRLSPQAKKVIENCLEFHDKYKSCYFWTHIGNAKDRRNQESYFENNNPSLKLATKNGEITVKPSLSISCKNFYYSLEILRDGRKSNVQILKNLIKL